MTAVDRIVVGVDGSEGSHRALAWAVGEARIRHGVVVAVHAWEAPIVAASPVGAIAPPPDDALLESGARATLDDALASVDPSGVAVELLTPVGAPGHVLCEHSKGAAMLVVGSSGHGAVVGAILGSVSQHCAHHARCPVVIVPRRA